MASVNLSEYGKYVSLQNVSGSGDPSSAPNGGVYLFASGTEGSSKLYLQNENSSTPIDVGNLSLDIDGFGALGGTGLAQSDKFIFSDGGDEKSITFSNLEDAIFGNVSGDATVAAGGALTIANAAVEHAMLANDCIDGDNIQDDVVNSEHLAAGAIDTEHIADNQVTLAKMAGITRGSIIVGDSSGDPSLLAKGSSAQFLQSDGTDPSYVTISGDATVAAGGALTIANDAVEQAMIADDAVGADQLASNAVVNASVDAAAAIAATKLDFNVDLGGNVTFGTQTNDTVTFTGHVNVGQQLTASHARITNLDVVTVNSVAETQQTLEIKDKLIVASLSASSANSSGGGLKIGGGMGLDGHASLLWDHANSALDFNIGGTTEMRLADGVLRPETDNDVDLGASGAEFKDLYLDGTANVDMLKMPDVTSGKLLVADGTSYEEVALSGDATLASNGALTIGTGVVEHAMLAADCIDGDNIQDDVVNSEHLAAGAIDTEHIADNQVTLAKMAGITRGSVIVGDASGDPSLLAKGTSGQFLQSDGTDPSYVTMSGDVASLASGGAVTLAAAQTNITSLLATDIKIGEDDQTKIDFETANRINFYADNAARAAITANGFGVGAGAGAGGASIGVDGTGNFDGGVVIGQDGSGAGLRVHGTAANEEMIFVAAENKLQFKKDNGSSAQETIMSLGGDEDTDFAIEVANGSDNINKIKAAAFVTYSDESLKSDVTSMGNTALDAVMSLNGVEFTWKDSGERDFGFIAQDVQKVVPKAVHTGGDGVQGVDYSRLTSVLVEAVKAQQVQIEELKALLKK